MLKPVLFSLARFSSRPLALSLPINSHGKLVRFSPNNGRHFAPFKFRQSHYRHMRCPVWYAYVSPERTPKWCLCFVIYRRYSAMNRVSNTTEAVSTKWRLPIFCQLYQPTRKYSEHRSILGQQPSEMRGFFIEIPPNFGFVVNNDFGRTPLPSFGG